MTVKNSDTAVLHPARSEDKVTPFMDELSKGPWPSHTTEPKKTRYPVMMYGYRCMPSRPTGHEAS